MEKVEAERRKMPFEGKKLTDFVPVIGAATPSLMLVAMVKEALKLAAGRNDTEAKRAFTVAGVPLAVQTPSRKVELTPSIVAVDKAPAARLERERVAVTMVLSISLTTMSTRFSGVLAMNSSAAKRLVALGGSLMGVRSKRIVLGVGSRSKPPLTMPPLSRTWKVKEVRLLLLASGAGV